jgi:hypothetical protein
MAEATAIMRTNLAALSKNTPSQPGWFFAQTGMSRIIPGSTAWSSIVSVAFQIVDGAFGLFRGIALVRRA